MREKAAFEAMPAEYRAIETSPTVTRAQLAALLGVRLERCCARARAATPPSSPTSAATGRRPGSSRSPAPASWSPSRITPSSPGAIVRRGDLAQAVSRVLGADRRREAAARRALARCAAATFSDVAAGAPELPGRALGRRAGVMSRRSTTDCFQLSRPVTGAEAVDAVSKLQELLGRSDDPVGNACSRRPIS